MKYLVAILLIGINGEAVDSSGPWHSEQAVLAHLENRTVALGGDEEWIQLIRLCLAQSWWMAARSVVAHVHTQEAAAPSEGVLRALRQEVITFVTRMKHRASEFVTFSDRTFQGQSYGFDEVPCALQWAQNSTFVFLNAKYAVRWSAPAAVEVADVSVNVTRCCFELEGFGHHSNVRKRYSLNLVLYGEIVPNQSSWVTGSVGRITATLQKASRQNWQRLTKMKGKSRHQIGPWLDMNERWGKDAPEENFSAEPEKANTRARANKSLLERYFGAVRKSMKQFWKKCMKRIRGLRQLPPMLLFCGVVLIVVLLIQITRFLRASFPSHRR